MEPDDAGRGLCSAGGGGLELVTQMDQVDGSASNWRGGAGMVVGWWWEVQGCARHGGKDAGELLGVVSFGGAKMPGRCQTAF